MSGPSADGCPEEILCLRPERPGWRAERFRADPCGQLGLSAAQDGAVRAAAAAREFLCGSMLADVLADPVPDDLGSALDQAWNVADLAACCRTYSQMAGDVPAYGEVCRMADDRCREVSGLPGAGLLALALSVLGS